ncbi:probable starch synthase 4, chloroplastic/amyloplastic isoform X3 [Amaranthus tricolor]|uniref:probable starch synthase 4, chloroplastic/amyloplastic isoform X3 n=1 Tax=Amaranthus tricolor TaxID=29722 RepID=UPI002586CE30|nr:probable starch synthase 4, chloroplastic/amyloplastic isoform X3 [Amaranthus tricolor]
MAVLPNSLFHLPLFSPKLTKNPIRAPVVRLRLEDHDNFEFTQNNLQSTSTSELELRSSEVWKLFTEAQQNIMYLNKQRIMALEELNKAKKEIETLHQRIESLEAGKHETTRRDDSSVLWQLLLRLDSMVLAGMIDRTNACDLRRLVMNTKVNENFMSLLLMRDDELLAELNRLSEQNKRSGFHIVHICTEMEPLAAVGSLGSYVTGVSCASQRKGNLVEVILPKYKSLDLSDVQGLQEIHSKFYSYFYGQLHGNKLWTGSVVHGIGVTFIQPLDYSSLFDREMIYGYSDDFERFTYFSRASLDYLVKLGKHPDVLHIHNWETAIIGPLFWDIFVNQGLTATRILLTCQGFDSQCLEQPEKLELCGLDPSRLHRPDRLQDNAKSYLVNVLKGGVIYSNKVVVMSSINSKGRIIRSLGHGLEPTLSTHKDKLVVAPYGLDHTVWDPSTDELLPQNYSVNDLKGKSICKASLQRQMGLSEDASSTLVGCIFFEISDVDLENLIALLQIAELSGLQFLFMGVSKLPRINSVLQSLNEELEGKNMRFINKYDEAFSHLLFGGSDIILCHSYEDPVLQVPLKAIRYGAAPILATSIEKRVRHFAELDFGSTQFAQYISTFSNMSLLQAVDEIRNKPSEWNQKIKEAMLKDFSWDAECYDVHISAYESIKNL